MKGAWTMFCKHCGAKLPDGVSFCTNCGQDVRPASPAGSASAAGAAASEVRPAFRGSAAAFAAAANPSPSETCTAYKGNPTAAAPSASAGCAAYGDKPGAGAAAFVTPASDETPRLSVPPEIPGHEPHDAGASVSWARSAGADRTSGVGATPAYGAGSGVSGATPPYGAGSGVFGATPAYGAGTTGAYGTDTAVETEAPKKNRTLAIVLSICGGLLLIGVGVLLFFLLRKPEKIDLNKYFSFEVSGYDGAGKLKLSIDWDRLEADCGDDLKLTDLGEKTCSLGTLRAVDLLKDGIYVEASPRDNLSNGDTVSYRWVVNPALKSYIKNEFVCGDGSITVSGLELAPIFDPFEDLIVTFSGSAPDGYVSWEYVGSDYFGSYDFSPSRDSGLSNGDVVTFTLDVDPEDYLEDYGKLPTRTEQTYTVSGLPEYTGDVSGISDEMMEQMKREAVDYILSYTAGDYNVSDLNLAGWCFRKYTGTPGYYDSDNAIDLIFTGTFSSRYSDFPPGRIYYPVRFTNIRNTDGETTYDELDGIQGVCRLDVTYSSSTLGYRDPYTCYHGLATEDSTEYEITFGGGFEAYSSPIFISSLSDVSDSCLDTLCTDAEDRILAYAASTYGGDLTINDLQHIGYYLLTRKMPDEDYGENNDLYVICTATVSDGSGNSDTVYYPVHYKGIVKLPGGEYLTTYSYGIEGGAWFENVGGSTLGYLDGEEMYTSIVTANRDSCYYEVSGAVSVFGS